MTLLNNLHRFLVSEVSDQRSVLDHDVSALKKVFTQMIQLGGLGIHVPKHFGGLALNAKQQHEFIRNIARASGALMLLQTQHQSVQAQIVNFADDAFKSHWLPKSCREEYLLGIGYSHLHQIANPPVIAQEHDDHYVVHGTVRYATGYGLLNWIALGFICGDQEFIALTPFSNSAAMRIQEPLALIAATSTQTIRGIAKIRAKMTDSDDTNNCFMLVL